MTLPTDVSSNATGYPICLDCGTYFCAVDSWESIFTMMVSHNLPTAARAMLSIKLEEIKREKSGEFDATLVRETVCPPDHLGTASVKWEFVRNGHFAIVAKEVTI